MEIRTSTELLLEWQVPSILQAHGHLFYLYLSHTEPRCIPRIDIGVEMLEQLLINVHLSLILSIFNS